MAGGDQVSSADWRTRALRLERLLAFAPPWLAPALEVARRLPGQDADPAQLSALFKKARQKVPTPLRPRLDVLLSQFRLGTWKARRAATQGMRKLITDQDSKHGASWKPKVKAEPGVKPVKVKVEPGTKDKSKPAKASGGQKKRMPMKARGKAAAMAPKERKGFARAQRSHFRHQVQLIDRIVPPPWRICFGGLGSGIIGVVPGEAKAKAVVVKKEKASASSSVRDVESSPAKVRPNALKEDEDEDAPVVPSDASIILFLNSASFKKQSRNGKISGCYEEKLDTEKGVVRWSSQRRDKHNRIISTIIGHNRRGGRVVAATRGAAVSDLEDKSNFKLLGEVVRMDDVHLARTLVEEGDTVIREMGTDIHHKAILPTCLTSALKSGIGLRAVPVPRSYTPKWCSNCCFEPPSALLHFKELHKDGVDAFTRKEEKRRMKVERIKKEKEEDKEEEEKVEVESENKGDKRKVGAKSAKRANHAKNEPAMECGEKRRRMVQKGPVVKQELADVPTPVRVHTPDEAAGGAALAPPAPPVAASEEAPEKRNGAVFEEDEIVEDALTEL